MLRFLGIRKSCETARRANPLSHSAATSQGAAPADRQFTTMATTVTHITLRKRRRPNRAWNFIRQQRRSSSGTHRELSFRIAAPNRPIARRIGRSLTRARRDQRTERNVAVRELEAQRNSINGKQIRDAAADGDILKVAETEIRSSPRRVAVSENVTQPIQSRKVAPGPYTLPPEVAAIRMRPRPHCVR